MSFFSRLSDIIGCNLNEILGTAADPRRAIRQIILEMEEGLAGAMRSVTAAGHAVQRLGTELDEHRAHAIEWGTRAREELGRGRDDLAREALVRKRELEDLLAGLEQQHAAAVATRDQLTTTLRAIHARLAEARRIEQALEARQPDVRFENSIKQPEVKAAGTIDDRGPAFESSRDSQIEAELEALRRELQQGK